jgi:hypothetical protein
MSESDPFPRFLSAGPACVYVLPCREQDVLKVGFSRDPLQRLHTLHRRFFEFFDLDRALLIEADTVREARFIERALIQGFAGVRIPAPLAVRQAAGGRTEWFAGAAPDIETMARALALERGYVLYAPLSAWLRGRFTQSRDVLYGWSARMLDAVIYEQFNVPASGSADTRPARALRATLDMLVALDMDMPALVPPAVIAWYQYGTLPDTR